MEYIPNGYIFLVGAIISVLAVVPLAFAWKFYKDRIANEAAAPAIE